MARVRAVLVLVLVTIVAALFVGCGEDLDTGEAVPPATEVVTDTTGEETTTDGETTTGGDVNAGEGIFASAGCGGCHTLQAAGASGTVGPNLDEARPSLDQAVTTITNGRGGMPAFEGQLSEEDIRNVAAFVAESAGG